MRRAFNPFSASVISSCLGRRCIVCGNLHSFGELRGEICSTCREILAPVTNGFCPGCGLIYHRNEQSVYLCRACKEKRTEWSNLGFFSEYNGLLKRLIIDFKFNRNLGLSKPLQDLMYRAYLIHNKQFSPEMIIPVPLHAKRLLQRGFNQSIELSRKISVREGIEIASRALARPKNTKSQVGLSKKERTENLSQAIKVEKNEFKNKNVLLVDDIFTTGATIQACAESLNSAGARRVDVLVLARVGDYSQQ